MVVTIAAPGVPEFYYRRDSYGMVRSANVALLSSEIGIGIIEIRASFWERIGIR